MQIIYPWIVFVHVLAAFGFVLAHGASAFVSFRLRGEQDAQRIALLLDLSRWSTPIAYGSLLVLVVFGVIAGVAGQMFGRLWIWAAIAVLVAVTVAMLAVASPFYERVRVAVGMPSRGHERGPAPEPVGPAELAALLDSRRPEALAAIGGIGLAVLIWLMIFKPF